VIYEYFIIYVRPFGVSPVVYYLYYYQRGLENILGRVKNVLLTFAQSALLVVVGNNDRRVMCEQFWDQTSLIIIGDTHRNTKNAITQLVSLYKWDRKLLSTDNYHSEHLSSHGYRNKSVKYSL